VLQKQTNLRLLQVNNSVTSNLLRDCRFAACDFAAETRGRSGIGAALTLGTVVELGMLSARIFV